MQRRTLVEGPIEHGKECHMATTPTVILVNGAFCDASGYAGVIRILQSKGVEVRAPMNPLRGLAFDADAVTRYRTAVEGPVLLVGHSYGGAVTSQAVPAIEAVTGLVILSAFALDERGGCASLPAPFPEAPLASTNLPNPHHDPAA